MKTRVGISAILIRYASRLRFPYLFGITAILFVVDLIWPDFVPVADELLLGLLTALFGTWRRRKSVEPAKRHAEPPTGPAGEE